MFYKSFDDEVFAKFLNYMQKALLHKKLNYIRDYKKINEMECSFEGLDKVLQSNEKMDFDVCNFLSEKEPRVLKLHFKGKLTYKEMLEDNLFGLGMVLAHELNGVLVLSVGVLINVDIMKKYIQQREIQMMICVDKKNMTSFAEVVNAYGQTVAKRNIIDEEIK